MIHMTSRALRRADGYLAFKVGSWGRKITEKWMPDYGPRVSSKDCEHDEYWGMLATLTMIVVNFPW